MRAAGFCLPDDVWYEDNSGHGTVWRGSGIWVLSDVMRLVPELNEAPVEIVTDLSPSNTTHPLLQTVADGRADVGTFEVIIYYTVKQVLLYV